MGAMTGTIRDFIGIIRMFSMDSTRSLFKGRLASYMRF